MLKKTVKESETKQVQLVLPEHLNPSGRLFGGRLLEWIDIVAAITAQRHAGCHVTTASIDRLSFKEGAFPGDTLVLRGRITYAGKTSMEIRVDTFREELSGKRRLINCAYLVMVAIDRLQKPVEIPPLELLSKTEKLEWEAAKIRALKRKERRSGALLQRNFEGN